MSRVCMLTSVHEPFDVRIFHKEAQSLARAGYRVSLVAFHERDEVRSEVEIASAGLFHGGRLARMTRGAWAVYRRGLKQKARVYHFHDPELIPLGLLLRARGLQVIYDVHEDLPRAIQSKSYIHPWGRWFLGWMAEIAENLSAGLFSAVIAATPSIADRFRKWNKNCSIVQNYPLPEDFLAPAPGTWTDRSPTVGYVGGMTDIRGIREMVQARDCLPKSLNLTLKLAGHFSPLHLRDEVAMLPGWGRVEDLGYLDRMAVGRLLSKVRAGLVLFHPEPNHIQAQPNKIFEYMSAGIPVVASDFPLWREIIMGVGCGLVVDPLDVGAIAEAIEYLVVHPQEAEAMGRRGREAVKKKFNWPREEQKLIKLYKDLAI